MSAVKMNENKKPFLSVITINYNNIIGLEKTIQSVVSQLFSDFEYIVIDGGSNDGSKQYVESKNDCIDFWVSEPDNGIYNAMNKGVEASNGNYLLFLNSGDILNGSNALKTFIEHQNFQGDIIYGDYKFETGGKVYPDNLTPLFFVRTSLPHQSTFFNRKVFDIMGLYDERYKIVADRAFYIKCFLSSQFVFSHINYPLTVFDLSGVSNDPLYKEKQFLENESMFQELYDVFYEDYKNMLLLQSHLNQVKRETVAGVLKRIVNKIKKVFFFRIEK
jgi:glycosyltransferase involved in cell wall biosynthesis